MAGGGQNANQRGGKSRSHDVCENGDPTGDQSTCPARFQSFSQRASSTIAQPMKCTLCEDSGWVCEAHPQMPGKASTPVSAEPPVCPVLGATSLLRASSPECRRGSIPSWIRMAGAIEKWETKFVNARFKIRTCRRHPPAVRQVHIGPGAAPPGPFVWLAVRDGVHAALGVQ